jgi:hypothetical protein
MRFIYLLFAPNENKLSHGFGRRKHVYGFFELTLVLVPFDHVFSSIVNANDGIV